MAKMAAEENPVLLHQRHRELFVHFCRQKFRDGGRGCSKTVSSKKREKVLRYLGNQLDQSSVTPHFRFWVKQRGFQLVELNEGQAVCLPNKQWVESDPKSVQFRRVSSVEEFFDVIASNHLQEDGSHLGIKKTLGRIVESYDCVPRTAVEGFIDLCPGCRGRARKRSGRVHNQSHPSSYLEDDKGNLLSFMSSTQVDLIDMSPHADGQYTWLGHFADHWSCFHVLFPLTSVSADEVAQNICRLVFGVFGVPQSLHCNLGRQFTTQVVQCLSSYWQGEIDTEVATTRPHNPVLDESTSKLEEMIAEYVAQRPLWTQWLPFVQYTLNTEVSDKMTVAGSAKSPYNMVFSNVVVHRGGGEEEEEEEEGEGEEEEEEVVEEGERLQLEVISDSITLPPTAWQANVPPPPPPTASDHVTLSSSNNTAVQPQAGKGPSDSGGESQQKQNSGQSPAAKSTPAVRGGGGGGGGGKGDDMSVQQILMPPDADFLSSFYEAAQLTEGNTRKRRRKQTPSRVWSSQATPTPATPTNITSSS